MEVLYQLSYRGIFLLCGGGRIRTSVGEAGRFTVCSLWPLGHTPGHAPAALFAERPNMVANATDFSTEEKGLRGTSYESPGRDSNPRPAAYKAAALPLSYPGAPPQAAHAGFASLSARSSLRLPLSARSGLRPHISARFGPSVLALSKSLSRPARSRDCNSASPAPKSVFAESVRREPATFPSGVSLPACARSQAKDGLLYGTCAGRRGCGLWQVARPGGSRTRAGWRGWNLGRGPYAAGRSPPCRRWPSLPGWRAGVRSRRPQTPLGRCRSPAQPRRLATRFSRARDPGARRRRR